MNRPLQERTLAELLHKGRYLYPTAFVDVIERFHATDGPGVPREVLSAYVTEVVTRMGPGAPFTPARFLGLLDRRVTDLETWLPDALYEVAPGRLSVYPPGWHQQLTGVRDPARYVRVIGEDLAAVRGTSAGGPMPPVPVSTLVDAMMVLGGVERSTANSLVQDARHTGRLVVEPSQNPEASAWLPPTQTRSRQPPTAEPPGREVASGPETRRGSS